MSKDVYRVLFHPFESGGVTMPSGARVLLIGAEPGLRLPEEVPPPELCVQGFRPHLLALRREGWRVDPLVAGGPYDAALVLCGRHRGENERRLAKAFEQTVTDGLIVVAGLKETGIASLAKRVEKLIAIKGQIPKHHGIAIWLHRPADPANAIASLRQGAPDALVEERFQTAPGMFSFDRVDAGSRLLASNLPTDLKGAVADFCAGWGYLAAVVADHCPRVKNIDVYEADFASLEAAKANLAELKIPVAFYWHDLVSEPVQARYDTVVMNPPFHAGRAADPALGQAIIRCAHSALRKGGRLLMVANRNLPYERTLQELFARHERLVDEGGFKVITATR